MITPDPFGRRLYEKRRDLRLTQQEVGERVGVTAAAVGRWEMRGGRPRPGTDAKLAEVLKCSLDWLLYGDIDEEEPCSPAGDESSEKPSIVEILNQARRLIEKHHGIPAASIRLDMGMTNSGPV